jgi:FtsP/CotA-like multicopper oxidase with cupredoxin domain
MSRNQRVGLVVVALIVAVVAFVVARPGTDDDNPQPAAKTSPAETKQENGEAAAPAEPQVARIKIRDAKVVAGPQRVEATKGETVRIVVSADAPDEIHLHGYDIEREAQPGRPARFNFKADIEGIFELESHTAEDAGLDPLVARLVVQPSS